MRPWGKALTAALLGVLACAAPAVAQVTTPFHIGQHSYSFQAHLPSGRRVRLNYLLFLPASYGRESNERWPLLVFLHGSREVGSDLNRLRQAILPQLVESNPDFPLIVVSPQAPGQQYGWYPSLDAIRALLDQLQHELAIDPDRIYLTGLSMGGYGAWALAVRDPERFAAIVPVVGGYFYGPRQLCALSHKPIWVFAARRDRNVPLRESERVVRALRACGGQPRYTVFEDADHDQGWRLAYTSTDLFDWLLQQKRIQ